MFDIQIHKNGVFIDSTKGYSHILGLEEIVNFPSCMIDYWDPAMTMWDFFSIVEVSPSKWQNITGNTYIEEYVEEFQKIKTLSMLADSLDLYYLELCWHSELWGEEECQCPPLYNTKKAGQLLDIVTRLYGVGPPNSYSVDSTEKYAIDFIPLENLLNLEIKLNPQIDVLFEDDLQDIRFSAKKKFSVADVIGGIFWELTWDGGPKEKREALEQLKNSKI